MSKYMSIAASIGLSTTLMVSTPHVFAATPPDCTNKDAWPSTMAFTELKNENLLSNENVNFSKTVVSRIASEKIGSDLYKQVHLVRFTKTDGNTLSAITVNDVSSEECSMSDVDIYVINKKIGTYTK